MRKQRSRPLEGRPLSERHCLEGQCETTKTGDYDEAAGKSTPGAKAKGGGNVSAR
jgi:hypothetical protein